MIIKDVINTYRKVENLPRECHIGWLRNNFNPILKSLDSRIIINWSCNGCIKSHMNMLIGWLDREEEKHIEAAKKKRKKPTKRNPIKRKTIKSKPTKKKYVKQSKK